MPTYDVSTAFAQGAQAFSGQNMNPIEMAGALLNLQRQALAIRQDQEEEAAFRQRMGVSRAEARAIADMANLASVLQDQQTKQDLDKWAQERGYPNAQILGLALQMREQERIERREKEASESRSALARTMIEDLPPAQRPAIAEALEKMLGAGLAPTELALSKLAADITARKDMPVAFETVQQAMDMLGRDSPESKRLTRMLLSSRRPDGLLDPYAVISTAKFADELVKARQADERNLGERRRQAQAFADDSPRVRIAARRVAEARAMWENLVAPPEIPGLDTPASPEEIAAARAQVIQAEEEYMAEHARAMHDFLSAGAVPLNPRGRGADKVPASETPHSPTADAGFRRALDPVSAEIAGAMDARDALKPTTQTVFASQSPGPGTNVVPFSDTSVTIERRAEDNILRLSVPKVGPKVGWSGVLWRRISPFTSLKGLEVPLDEAMTAQGAVDAARRAAEKFGYEADEVAIRRLARAIYLQAIGKTEAQIRAEAEARRARE